MAPSGSGGGHERRRARTRAALVSAALGFLVEGRTDVAVQEITEAAGVGQGSFYNHFVSKEALYDAALEETLLAYGRARDELVAGITDPAEVFVASFRITGRLLGKNPVLTKLMIQVGTKILIHDVGLRPRALHDLVRARDAGLFDFEDPEVALMSTGALYIGMAQLIDAGREVAATTDEFAVLALRLLSCDPRLIADLVGRPLPEAPTLASFLAVPAVGSGAH